MFICLSLNDPCGGSRCRRPFPFINNLPLTDKSQLFVDKVNNESISGNLDFPEGGMDALMQVLVCGDVSWCCDFCCHSNSCMVLVLQSIGWRAGARRIVVMATDAGFHFAGDGKVCEREQGNLCFSRLQCHCSDDSWVEL